MEFFSKFGNQISESVKTFIEDKYHIKGRCFRDNLYKGYELETYLFNSFESMGYKVEVVKRFNHQDGELIIYKDNIKMVVLAKIADKSVEDNVIKEAIEAITYHKVTKGIVITNSSFTSSALSLAKENNIGVIDGTEFDKLSQLVWLT